jgi:hypothetical protein
MDKFCVEGLTKHSNIFGCDENTHELFHDSIHEIYQELFGETIEHSQQVQKKNRHSKRELIKERLQLCFEVDREARKLPYRSLVQLEKYDDRGSGLYVLKLFFKYVVMKPIINFIDDISYRMWWMVKSLAKYYFFIGVTKPYEKVKKRVMILVRSLKNGVAKHLTSLNTASQ